MQAVHSLDHRVNFIIAEFLNEIVLNGVSAVDKKQGGIFCALLLNDSSGFCKTSVECFVCGVVPRSDHSMNIACLKNSDCCVLRERKSRNGEQCKRQSKTPDNRKLFHNSSKKKWI